MFGSIKRSKAKIRKAYYKLGMPGRHVKIDVVVSRAELGMGGSGRMGYGARACVAGAKRKLGRVHRCGSIAEASTPTAAIRKALRSLAAKKNLR